MKTGSLVQSIQCNFSIEIKIRELANSKGDCSGISKYYSETLVRYVCGRSCAGAFIVNVCEHFFNLATF